MYSSTSSVCMCLCVHVCVSVSMCLCVYVSMRVCVETKGQVLDVFLIFCQPYVFSQDLSLDLDFIDPACLLVWKPMASSCLCLLSARFPGVYSCTQFFLSVDSDCVFVSWPPRPK